MILMSSSIPSEPETYSLFGEPLRKAPPNEEAVKTQKKLYGEALKNYEKDPENPDNIIWMGRRTAYLGNYRRAIAIFSEGVKKHPEEPRMYRHRGHRFISLRFFDQAVTDLEKAAELIKGKPDEIEPNGIANTRGVALGTLRFNIWYHLGLAYYLKGDMENALRAYESCMDASTVDDKKISTGHWYYMTLRRLGREDEAQKFIMNYSRDMDVVENGMYLDCLMMYKGELAVEELKENALEIGSLGLATSGYGVANWYNYNGEKEKAVEMYREILSKTGWPGFGHIAAEADLYHMGVTP
jgi:tetratricopeptide (TPR) repeat protein